MKILLASDGSEGALHAAALVGHLARGCRDACITILYVVPRPEVRVVIQDSTAYAPDVPLDAMIAHTAQPVWAATRRALGELDGPVASEVAIGDPAEEIARLAEWERYDLIVVGRRGLGVLKELLLGSVSHRLVHRATVPVLVAR